LTRVYSVASLIGIGLVAIVLSWLYRTVSVNGLLEHETQSNLALAQAMANTIWPPHAEFIAAAGRLPRDQLAARAEIVTLDRDVRQKVRGLDIVKVKIYTLDGLTVYSSEPRQIGEDKSANAGFRLARSGEVASELVYRNNFSAFEREIEDRDLLSSYIPITHAATGATEGVFEIYSDVTRLVRDIRRTGYVVVGVVTGLSLLLYTFLFLMVRRADRVIQRHEDEERTMQRDQIRHLAYHDVLTGLANRMLFKDRLQHAVAIARRENRSVGLMFLDLDRFKVVNDSLGHESGDQVLVEAAARIRARVRQADTVCRTGGDEFVVILEALSGPEEAEVVAERLLQAFNQPMRIANRELVLSLSIGIAICPDPTNDPARLLSDADTAMRHAKDRGRSHYAFYSAELDERARQNIEYELRAAQRARQPRAGDSLPAPRGPCGRQRTGTRGPAALATTGKGAYPAERLRAVARGHRPHHPCGGVGDSRGLPPVPVVAGRRTSRPARCSKSVTAPVPFRNAGADGAPGADAERLAGTQPGVRADRERAP
jgi:diguanylate cyclase (GGDEF)-like protein